MDTTAIETIVAFFVPLLVSVLKKERFSNTVNAIIAMAVYAVVGVAAVLLSGKPVDINNIAPTVAIFVAGGTVAYEMFWKNWGDPQVTAKVLP